MSKSKPLVAFQELPHQVHPCSCAAQVMVVPGSRPAEWKERSPAFRTVLLMHHSALGGKMSFTSWLLHWLLIATSHSNNTNLLNKTAKCQHESQIIAYWLYICLVISPISIIINYKLNAIIFPFFILTHRGLNIVALVRLFMYSVAPKQPTRCTLWQTILIIILRQHPAASKQTPVHLMTLFFIPQYLQESTLQILMPQGRCHYQSVDMGGINLLMLLQTCNAQITTIFYKIKLVQPLVKWQNA